MNQPVNSLDRYGKRLDVTMRAVACLGFSGLVAMALLTMTDALSRWLGFPRIPGLSDYAELVYALVIATCFPTLLLRQGNVTIRFLGMSVGRRLHAWLEVFGAVMTLGFFALLVWQFFLMTADFQANNRVSATVELPVAPWWWITTIIMTLTIPVQVWVLIHSIFHAISGKGPVEPEHVSDPA